MKKRVCALFLAVLMIVTAIAPLGSNENAAKAANVDFSVDIDNSLTGDVQAIKAEVLKAIDASADIEDYDFFYEFSFDSYGLGSTFTPAFILSDERLFDYFGDDTVVADATSKFSSKAVNVLHNKFSSFAKSSNIVKSLAKEYGLTTDELVDLILPAGEAGKAKLQSFASKKYMTLFDGFDGAGAEGTLSMMSNCTSSDCVAYLPFTVNGETKDKAFGITLPAIYAGVHNVKVVSVDGKTTYNGTVNIAKKDASFTLQNVSEDGFATATGEGIDVFKANCDSVEVYIGYANCELESIKDLGSQSDKAFASIIIPESLSEINVAASYGHESFASNIANTFDGKTLGFVLDKIEARFPGKGEAVRKSINSYFNGNMDEMIVCANKYPSEVGTYYATTVSYDPDYTNAYETALYAIVDASTKTDKLTFNTEAKKDTLLVTDDLSSSLGSLDLEVQNVFIGNTENGNFIEKLEELGNKAANNVTDAKAKDLINSSVEKVSNGEAPEGFDKLFESIIMDYDIENDDDALVKFSADIIAAFAENGFDSENFGIYRSEEEVKAQGEGSYLQISYVPSAEGYIVLPIYRKLILTGAVEATDLSLNLESVEMPTDSTLQLEAITNPVNTISKITWTTSDSKIATVDENGLVSALRYGTVTITASTDNGLEASCEIQTRYYDVNGTNVKGEDNYQYYWNAVYWAADIALTKGYDGVYFGPELTCDRREMLIFIWRMAGSPAAKGDARKYFNDIPTTFSKKSDSNKAIAWAYENGVTKGYDDGGFHPASPIKRFEALIMLYRFAGRPDVTGEMKFTDVVAGNYSKKSDTYRSILWASKKKITNGYADGTFGVKEDCLREHIITFIYRYAKLKDSNISIPKP